MPKSIILLVGQANARFILPDETPATRDTRWVWCAREGSSLAADWGDGSLLENVLVGTINHQPAGIDITWAWIHGETDSQVIADADAYETNRDALRTRVLAATGRRSIYTVEMQLHNGLTRGAKANRNKIRTAKTDFVTGLGAAGLVIDPTPLGDLSDGVHYDSDCRIAVASAIYDAHVAKF